MAHTMGKRIKDAVASGMKQGKQLLERAPEPAIKETKAEKALRVAGQKVDDAGRRYHEDSKTPTRKALAKAEAEYRKAWHAHDKAGKT